MRVMEWMMPREGYSSPGSGGTTEEKGDDAGTAMHLPGSSFMPVTPVDREGEAGSSGVRDVHGKGDTGACHHHDPASGERPGEATSPMEVTPSCREDGPGPGPGEGVETAPRHLKQAAVPEWQDVVPAIDPRGIAPEGSPRQGRRRADRKAAQGGRGQGGGQPPGQMPAGYWPEAYYGQAYPWSHAWYPPYYPPPGFGYYPPYPQAALPGHQTGLPPAGEPAGREGGDLPEPPGDPYQGLPPEEAITRDAELFKDLEGDEGTVWRLDLKWVCGIVAALLLASVLVVAGLYRVTGQGRALEILVGLIERTTTVTEVVEDNYQDLQSQARRSRGASFEVPDIGVEVSLTGETIVSLGAEDLADRVVSETAKVIYAEGYAGGLPMKEARGPGEERGKATTVTLMSVLNRKTHQGLLVPLIVLGCLALALGAVFMLLCRRWGRLAGPGIAIISISLLFSVMLRLAAELVWQDPSGIYRAGANQALRLTGALMVPYFDIALGVGALLLLAGVIGGIVARKSRERVPPFIELEDPQDMVTGGPPLEPGLDAVRAP